MSKIKLDQEKRDILMGILESTSPEKINKLLEEAQVYGYIKLSYDRTVVLPLPKAMELLNLIQSGEQRKQDGYSDPYYICSWEGSFEMGVLSKAQYTEEKMMHLLFQDHFADKEESESG